MNDVPVQAGWLPWALISAAWSCWLLEGVEKRFNDQTPTPNSQRAYWELDIGSWELTGSSS
jgi:hypothetical protein